MSNPEAEIAAQLSASLERLEQVDDAPSSSTAVLASPDEPAPGETPLDPIRAKHELMEFFQVPAPLREAGQMASKVEAILSWAYEEAEGLVFERAVEMADVLKVINDRMRMMGWTVAEDRVGKLWQYTRIARQRRLLDQQERGLYG